MQKFKEAIDGLLKKKIVSNFFYLSLIQVANSILPFIIIPHLVVTIGIDKVGIVFMSQATMAYLGILTDYGFNMTATKFISINRNSRSKLKFIFNAVISTKLMLIVIALLILLLLMMMVPIFKNEKLLLIFSFSIVISNTFFPVWFFQGMEEMRYISIMNLISKILFTLSIFFLITTKADYIKVNLLLGSGNMISCLIAFYIITTKYNIKTKLGTRYIKLQLLEGWHIFITNLAVSVYMYSNIFILGIFASKTALGYFSIADKCIQGIRQILLIFYQVIYPKTCILANTSHLLLIEFYKKVYLRFLLLIIFICLAIFGLAPLIAYLLTKSHHQELIIMLRIMCFIPIIVALNIPFSQSVIIYQIKKGYSIILISGSVINLTCNIFFAKKYNAFGTIGSIYITEIFITLCLFLLLQYTAKGKYSLKGIFSV